MSSDPMDIVYKMISFNDYLDEIFPPPPFYKIETKGKDTLVLVFHPVDSLGEVHEKKVSIKYINDVDMVVASNNVNLLLAIVSTLRLIGGKPSLPFIAPSARYCYVLVWGDTDKIISHSLKHRNSLFPIELLPVPVTRGNVYSYTNYPEIEYITTYDEGVPIHDIITYEGEKDFVKIVTDTYKEYIDSLKNQSTKQ